MSHEPSAVRCEGTTRRRPILFLDVDGVIIPYGGAETAPDSATVALFGPEADEDHLSRIDPEHGPRLSDLECSLVWATGWEDEANDVISPRVGLPRLPVVAWSWSDVDGPRRLHWKTRDLIAFADGRPFVWVDDELGEFDREWVTLHHPAPALLHHIDARIGLTGADIAAIGDWLTGLPTQH
jgi:hypothetical protein